VTYSRSLCIHNPPSDFWEPLVAVRSLLPRYSIRTMSRCAPPADDTLVYQSVHSTPPRRPSAGVSRYDTLPLTMLSRTPTDSSAISAGPISPQEVAAHTSSRWPWTTSSVDSDDREKTALVAGKGNDTQEVTMKPWEGWRVVLLGSCRSMACFVRHKF
jgi:hypothetical protein